jgi:glutathione S-transferase
MRTLYHTPLSPFCRKIRIQLREKGLEHALVEEPIWERREEFFALNPAGEVPVLQEDNDLILSGSYAISEYIEEAYPDHDPQFLGSTLEERAEVRRLVTWFDLKFYQEVTQCVLFEKVYRPLMHDGQPDSCIIRMGKKNILYHLDYIAFLTRDSRWLAGDHLTLADLAAASHLSALDFLGDVPWDHSPEAKDWYALIKSRPSFRPILADRVRGFRPPSWYDNPDF